MMQGPSLCVYFFAQTLCLYVYTHFLTFAVSGQYTSRLYACSGVIHYSISCEIIWEMPEIIAHPLENM